MQAYSSVNTLPAKVTDEEGNQALPGEGRAVSGLCGHAVEWAGLEMVKKLKNIREEMGLNYQIIIGVGGVGPPPAKISLNIVMLGQTLLCRRQVPCGTHYLRR